MLGFKILKHPNIYLGREGRMRKSPKYPFLPRLSSCQGGGGRSWQIWQLTTVFVLAPTPNFLSWSEQSNQALELFTGCVTMVWWLIGWATPLVPNISLPPKLIPNWEDLCSKVDWWLRCRLHTMPNPAAAVYSNESLPASTEHLSQIKCHQLSKCRFYFLRFPFRNGDMLGEEKNIPITAHAD